MFTLAGWSESQDTGGVLTAHAALADQHLTVDGDGIVVPEDLNMIVGAWAAGEGGSITRAQLQSPSIRRFIDAELSPLAAAEEPGDPPAFVDWRRTPLTLDPDELLEFHAAEGGASIQQTGLVWLADGPIQPVDPANIRTVRATAAATLVVHAWTNTGALTFAETLPAGRYAIVGFMPVSAGMQAARIVVPGAAWRPGALGVDSELGHAGHAMFFRNGHFGVYAEFDHNRLPTVDCLSLSADTSEVFLFDIVPL